MELTQERDDCIWNFISLINTKFSDPKIKIQCLINGMLEEVRNFLRPDIGNINPNLSWEEVIEGAQDAEYLLDLHIKEANCDLQAEFYFLNEYFVIDNQGYVVVFTGGACLHQGTPYAQSGIGIWFGHNHALNESEPMKYPTTNIVAELKAIIKAIDNAAAYGVEFLAVITDSMLIVDCFKKRWIHKWLSDGWITANEETVKNKIHFRELLSAMEAMVEVKFIHVDHRDGIYGNVEAYFLAKEGARKAFNQ